MIVLIHELFFMWYFANIWAHALRDQQLCFVSWNTYSWNLELHVRSMTSLVFCTVRKPKPWGQIMKDETIWTVMEMKTERKGRETQREEREESILRIDHSTPETSVNGMWLRDEPPIWYLPKLLTHKILRKIKWHFKTLNLGVEHYTTVDKQIRIKNCFIHANSEMPINTHSFNIFQLWDIWWNIFWGLNEIMFTDSLV